MSTSLRSLLIDPQSDMAARLLAATLICVFLLASPTHVEAQSIFASVTGTVTDPQGATIQGVLVTAENTATGLTRSSVTDVRGDYMLAQLPVGNYRVSAELKGFKKQVRTGLVLQVSQSARVDFNLQVGELTESVTVEAQVPLLDSETAAVGQVINNTQVLEMPLNGRNFNQLTLLASGVMPAPTAATSGGGSGYSVAGARGSSNSYNYDGVDNNDPGVVTVSLTPSIEMIQEFRIEENVYSAESGRYAGGQINLTTKSGTNSFHGSAFEFLRNSALDARNFFATGPQPFKQNQFGASFGGPIKRDKTFFYAVYEGWRIRQAQTASAAVPTIAMKAGNFAELLDPNNVFTKAIAKSLSLPAGSTIQLKNPLTGAPIPGNNIAAAGLINPIGQKITNLYPDPNSPPVGTVNFVNNSRRLLDDNDQGTVRVDHRFTGNASVFARYTYNSNFTDTPFPVGQTAFNDYSQIRPASRQNAVLSYLQVINPRVVNELRFGYSRYFNDIGLEHNDVNTAAQLGISGLDPLSTEPRYSGTPTLNVNGFGGIAYPPPIPQIRWNNTYQLVDTLSWNKGAHSFKFGANIAQYQIYQGLNGSVRGSFTFSGQFSAGFGSGFGLADLLMGLPSTSTRVLFTAPTPIQYQVQTSDGFFFQDNWKLTPNLTADVGLRYDLNLPLYWKGSQAAAFNPSLKVIEFPSEIRADLDPRKLSFPVTIPVPLQPLAGDVLCGTDKNNFAPRFGLAYRPFRDKKTVIRAGYGVFYQVDQFNSNCGSGTSLWSFSQTTQAPGPGSAPVATIATPFTGAAISSSLSLPANVPELHVTPYIQQWSLGIQREITPSLVLEVRYLGSKGTKLNLPMNLNQAPLCPSSVLNAPGGVTTCGNTTNVALANSLAARRPFSSSGFLSRIAMTSFASDSNFNALNVRLEKRTSRGLTFLATYAWAKSIDTSSGGDPQNVYDLAAERGLSAFDTRQRAVFSSTYELPFGNGRPFGSGWRSLTQAILGGWQVSEIFTAQAGTALTPTLGSTDNSLTGGNNDRPHLIRDPYLSDRTTLKWFDTGAFVVPARGTLGNAGRGVVTGPGLINIDFVLKKSFTLHENHRIEFRSEFFNATNTPHFNNPSMIANLASFGQITTAGAARQIQFALRYSF